MVPATPFFILCLASSALAGIYTTSPTAQSTFVAGQTATISWQDDEGIPALADFGPSAVSIFAGNAYQQTELLQISPNVDVSTVSSIEFVPPSTFGPDSSEYFVRFSSLSLKDTTNPAYAALAFSAKFTMSGMTGSFTPEVQAQIDGQSTAPVGGPTAAGSSSSSTARASTTSASNSASKTVNAAAAASETADEDGASAAMAASSLISFVAIAVLGTLIL